MADGPVARVPRDRVFAGASTATPLFPGVIVGAVVLLPSLLYLFRMFGSRGQTIEDRQQL